jgi:hypothetical protein
MRTTRLLLRTLTAAGVIVSAWVHYKLWNDGFRELPRIGPAFLVNAVAGLVIGVLLLAWWRWVPPLLAVGFGLATLGAFVTSATVGLWGVHELWTGTWVTTAWVSEVVAALGGAAVLLVERPWRTARLPRWSGRSSRRSGGQPQDGLPLRRADLD